MRKINEKSLSLPPYISTAWSNVSSLSMLQSTLIVELVGGRKIEIPGLDAKTLEAVFNAHAKFLENESLSDPKKSSSFLSEEQAFGFPIKFGTGSGGADTLNSAMQHNPDAADTPNLPPEILQKIISVAKVLGISESNHLPKAEPHCNCIHCQVARALHGGSTNNDENLDEEVSDEDLTFKTWDIHQKSDHLYVVINPLDEKELYNVYLGEPIGCTCGEKNCEHIKAVLNS